MTLHARSRSEAGGGEEGGGEIDVEREVVVGGAVLGGGHTGIADNEGRTDALLIRIPFVGEAVLGVEVAIVAGEDDERVFQDSLFAQFGEDAAARGVHFGRKSVVVFHHRLVFFGRIEAPVPADSAFVLLVGDEGREAAEVGVGSGGRDWNSNVFVEFHAARLGEVL